MLGVAIGFTLHGGGDRAAGLSAIFEHASPLIHQLLRYGGAAYLLYLAYRIATAARPRPMRPSRRAAVHLPAGSALSNGSIRRAG
jgi:threonine/homoserine/homoserine lactone efflux protein